MSAREDFWRRWSPWRHGEPGGANFADVMRVLALYETFSAFAVDALAADVARGAPVTVVDLGCGAAQMAAPLDRALTGAGLSLRRYVGVDFADRGWMTARTDREFARHGLTGRAEYVHHDLAAGLAPLSVPDGDALLIASCWGVTYLDGDALVSLLRQCAALAAQRPGGAVLSVNMMTAGRFDRDVLTRRFLAEVVPRHLREALRRRDVAPLREIALATRALPTMRAFGAEVVTVARLMPVDDFVGYLSRAGLSPSRVDATALWGQVTSFAVRLAGR